MSMPSPLPAGADPAVPWWRALLDRAGRQAAQTAVPVIAVIVASGGDVDAEPLLLGLAGALAVTLGKAAVQWLLSWHAAQGDTRWWVHLFDRAVPAAAGVLAGAPIATWADAVATDWGALAKASAAAAAVALLAAYTSPPATAAPVGVDALGDA